MTSRKTLLRTPRHLLRGKSDLGTQEGVTLTDKFSRNFN